VAAVIAATAGIAGSVVGARMSRSTIQHEARTSFARDQSLKTYSAFIDAFDANVVEMDHLSDALFERNKHPNDKRLRSAYNKVLDEQYSTASELSHAVTRMIFVGRERPVELANELFDRAEAAYNTIVNTRKVSVVDAEIERFAKDTLQLRRAFIHAATVALELDGSHFTQ